MTKNIDDAISDITDKIFKSGVIQNNIQEGSLSGLTISILGDEEAWSLDVYLHLEDRSSAEYIEEESEDDLSWAIQEFIEEQIEEDFEEIGFFAGERENINLNIVLRSST